MATPNLNLVYSSSAGGAGPYGEGWSLAVGSIERSGKWGVPRCMVSDGFDATDEFVLSLNGSAIELVTYGAGPNGSTAYRSRTDQSFLEAFRRTDNSWEVFDRSGMRYQFGTTAESRRTRTGGCGFTSIWGLTQMKDPNNNVVDVAYRTGENTLSLDTVQYGGTPSSHAFQVRFEYDDHPFPITSYRNGVLEVINDLVDRIHVEAKPTSSGSFGPLRIYDLVYDDDLEEPPAACDAPDRVLLCEVSVDDDMPTQSFEYSSGVFGLSAGTSQSGPGSATWLRNTTVNFDTEASVMDMNGDGRLDMVRAEHAGTNAYAVYYGLANGGIATSNPSNWCAHQTDTTIDGERLRKETAFNGGFAYAQKETIDLTGDGLADFVDADRPSLSPLDPATEWLVYPGSLSTVCPNAGTMPGFSTTAITWLAPESRSMLTQKSDGGNVIEVWKRLVDMNGDGRADLVIASAAAAEWEVYLNNGESFVDSDSAVAGGAVDLHYGTGDALRASSRETKSGGVRRTSRDLFDFNGDGLPDLVKSDGTQYLIHLNNGQSFDPGISIASTYAIREVHNESGQTLVDFIDVNGDGLPDRVRVDGGNHWQVSINRGTSLSPEQDWGVLEAIRRGNSKGNTKIDMIDWNHDGLLDRVEADDGGWDVLLGQPTTGPAIRPYLMTAARNGIGGVFHITYQPSTRFQNTLLPFVSWVVTATRKTDGLCTGTSSACLNSGNEIQRTYTYAEGEFDGPTREFRGFGLVTENFPGHPGGLVGRRETHFNQEEHSRGQVDLQETKVNAFGDGFIVVSRETFAWQTKTTDLPRTQVWLAEKKSEVFDVETGSGSSQCRVDRNVEPDIYGRVSTRCSLPCGTGTPGSCSAAVDGKVTTESIWADPSSSSIGDPLVRERPSSVTVSYVKSGGTSKTVSEQTFTYAWPAGNVLTATTVGDATTGGNATVATTYGNHGNMASVTDARNGQSTTVYSGTPFELFPSTETNAAGHSVHTQWDLRYGQEMQVIGPNGSSNGDVSSATYDKAGRVTCEAKPGNTCPGAPSAAYSYHYGDSEAAEWEERLSYVQVQTREPNNTTGPLAGYLLARTYFDGLGRERASAVWRWSDTADKLVWVVTKQIDYLGVGPTKRVYSPYQANDASIGLVGFDDTPPSASTEYEYFAIAQMDPTLRVRRVIASDGTATRTEYAGVWTHVYNQDINGQDKNKASSRRDFLGREVERKLYEGINTLKMHYTYAYDGLDRLLTTTVGGSTVTQDWDKLGRKEYVDDPDSGRWELRYDKNGNLTLQDDPKTGQRVETCLDAGNRIVLQCLYPSDGTSRTTFCPRDQVPVSSDPPACGTGGVEIARYFYDTDPDGAQECGGPGRVGHLTSVVDLSGGECWAYDVRRRVTTQKKTIAHGGTPTTAKMDFAYDDANHVLWVRYPEQTAGHEDYTYQPDGLPETLEHFVAAAEYDLFGRLIKLTSHRNTEDIYTYDTTGADNFRLQAIQTKKFSTGTVYLNLTHSYDERGKLKQVTDLRDAGTPLSNAASYCYDGLGRLTRVDRDPAGGSNPCTSAADEIFAHDDNGNLTSKNGSSFGFGTKPHQPTSFGVYSAIAYDANGSRTLKDKGSGNKDEFIYDARGNLVEVKRWTSGSVTSTQTNVYDYAGARVVRAPSSGAGTTIRTYSQYADVGGAYLTNYFYFAGRMIGTYVVSAPAHLLTEDDAPAVPPTRIQLPPRLLLPIAGLLLLLPLVPLGKRRALGVRMGLTRAASVSVVFLAASSPVVLFAGCGSDPVVRVYHGDHLGSAQVVTDWGGNIYRQIRYTAYGEIRGRYNSAGNPVAAAEDARFEFTGYETDFAGLDYAGARFFDPELAQFGTHDPAGQYPSPYAYGPGDPINGTDPGGASFLGLDILLTLMIMSIIASAVDAYKQTGSHHAAFEAGMTTMANQVTGGIYGAVEAQSNDDIGQYMANYALNMVTLGGHGMVQAFQEGNYASGVVAAHSFALAVYGESQRLVSAIATGNELAKPSGASLTQQSAGAQEGIDYAQAQPNEPNRGLRIVEDARRMIETNKATKAHEAMNAEVQRLQIEAMARGAEIYGSNDAYAFKVLRLQVEPSTRSTALIGYSVEVVKTPSGSPPPRAPASISRPFTTVQPQGPIQIYCSACPRTQFHMPSMRSLPPTPR